MCGKYKHVLCKEDSKFTVIVDYSLQFTVIAQLCFTTTT